MLAWFNTKGGKAPAQRTISCKCQPIETGARAWKSSIDCYVNTMNALGAPAGASAVSCSPCQVPVPAF